MSVIEQKTVETRQAIDIISCFVTSRQYCTRHQLRYFSRFLCTKYEHLR